MSLTTLDGRYHVLERIAAGGMGEVFRAHDVVLERQVAIKVLHRSLAGDPGFIERFRREARAAAGLNHPNIVAVHDWGATDGIYFMVMEYVSGRSVRDLLGASGRLQPGQAADILLQVLSALEHAHRQGIVHRDVKPENIMLTRDGVAKVADFGLARAYADARLTQAGNVSGTAQYLAPEQIQGEPADPRTDLYSLGIVAYELLTGRVPFSAETALAIAYRHLRDRVPLPSKIVPSVPPGLDGWVASMTEKEREMRPESASEAQRDLEHETATLPPAKPIAELVADLEGVIPVPDAEAEPAATVTIPRALPPRERKRRRRRRVAGVLIALVALAGAAWGAWTYVVPHYADVPSVVGLTSGQAQARIEDAGFTVKLGKGVNSTKFAQGQVVRVQPAPGTRIRTGSKVTLIPSLGPPPVPVPNLLGMTVPQARRALGRVDLSIHVGKRAYSETYAGGEISEQSVAADQTAQQGSAIDVTVSRGPFPAPVPKVIGLSQDKATSMLRDAGFIVKPAEAFSDTVPRGKVISQSPPAEAKLQPGRTVTITVSKGPESFALPSFVGMSRDAAVARIRSLGLVPQVFPIPGSTGDTVASQLPQAGTVVHAGATVTIYVL